MRAGFVFFCLSLVYLIFGILSANVSFDESTFDSKSRFYDYTGVLNVHSNRSSGSGSVQEIITAANNAELDFIFFNNENPVNEKQPSPITFGNLNVFYNLELSYKNSRFLKLSHTEAEVFESKSSIEISMSNSLSFSGEDLLILAHPDKDGSQWEAKVPKSLTGIEVVNLRETWNQAWKNKKLMFLNSLIFYPFNPKLFFLKIFSKEATSERTLNDFNKEHLTLGYLGSDATSKLKVFGSNFIKFPDYKTLFSLAKNHVLFEEELTGIKNHEKIILALKEGRSYFSLDLLGNPSGFSLHTNHNGKEKLVSKKLELNSKIFLSLPKHKNKMKVKIYRDGKNVSEILDQGSFIVDKAGIYRVRVDLNPGLPLIRSSKWIPWIYSNSFEVL